MSVSDLVLRLNYNYGVKKIYGIRNGYRGFYAPELQPPVELDHKTVDGIHHEGGTLLGTSRGTPYVNTLLFVLVVFHFYDQ